MKYIIEKEALPLIYQPGKGSWTYHLRIPHTKHIKGKWGDIKVSGSIDGYAIENRNLAPVKNEDKMLSVNGEIRNAINKSGGDIVKVTLYIVGKKESVGEKDILGSFDDAGVLAVFKRKKKTEQQSIIQHILSVKTEDKQIKLIANCIEQLLCIQS